MLDGPESQPYLVGKATKEFLELFAKLEDKLKDESKREPIDPRKIDIVSVLIGVGLLAIEIAFVVLVVGMR